MLLSPSDSSIDLLYGALGPTPRQIAFRDSQARYRLYGGAVGGGKSVAVCAEAIRASLAFPGNRGFLCRHESKAFKYTTLATLLKLISEIEDLTGSRIISNHHKTDQTIYFINGSVIIYGALGEIDDFEKIKSLEIGWFAIDEASETSFDNYCMLLSRLRWKLPDGKFPPYFGLLASNPEPGWVKDTFVKPQQMGAPLPEHEFIQALPSDNPHLPPDYIDGLRRVNPENWVRKYVEGSWDALGGQVWPMFSMDIHAIDSFVIPATWTTFRVLDHGQSHPTVCLWMAIDPEDHIYVYREYYAPGIVSQHAREIRAMSIGEEYNYTLLPPECWGKTREFEGKLWSIADEYAEYQIYCIPANNEVLAGINRVAEYFTVRPDAIHPLTAKLGSPRLFIFKNCRNLLLEIPDYIWKKQKLEELTRERPRKTKDDACDALRYGVMSRPSAAQLEKKVPFNSFLATRERLVKATNLAKRGGYSRHQAFDYLQRGLL